MNNFIKCIALVVAILIGTFVEYKFWTYEPQTYVQVLASGPLVEKISESYDCGKKRRNICWNRVLVTANGQATVDLDTYLRYQVGENIELTRTLDVDKTNAETTIFVLHWILIVILLVGTIATLITIEEWRKSGTKSLYDYMRNDGDL